MASFQTLRRVCIPVHECSVRFVHLVSTATSRDQLDDAAAGELLAAQRDAIDALLAVLAEQAAAEPHMFLEYALAAVLPMLSVRFEPRTALVAERLIECRHRAVRCVEALLQQSAAVAPATFTELLWILTGLVATPVDNAAASLRALRGAAVSCVAPLWRLAAASAIDVGALLIAELEPRRRVAFLLSQLLAVAGEGRDRDTSELALDAARALLQCVSKRRPFLAWCFPGVASAAVRLVLSDYRVGHRLRCGAVELLCDAVSLLLTDAATADVREAPPSLDSLRALVAVDGHDGASVTDDDGEDDVDKERTFVREPTARWFATTRTNLCAMLQRMYAAIGSESDNWTDGVVATVPWQLRQSLLSLAERLLETCRALLTDATTEALLDCVVVSTHHDQPIVAAAAAEAQQRLAARCRDVASLGAIQRSVHRQAAAIPRFVQGSAVHDAALLSALRLVHGYVAMLPSDASLLLLLRDSLTPLVTALAALFEPDLHSAVLSQIRSAPTVLSALELEAHAADGDDSAPAYPKRRYRRVRDERVADAAIAFSRLLGERTAARGQLHALVELFVAQVQDQRSTFRNGAVVLAVAALAGAFAASGAERARVRRAASMLLESAIECARDDDVALLVAVPEAIAVLAQCEASVPFPSASERRDAIDAHVMRTLHTLLDLLAHEQAAVQQAARASLLSLARLSGVADVSALVRLNADYVVDCACRRIRHEPELHAATARILLSVMRHVDSAASLSLLVDAVETVTARLVRCDTASAGVTLALLAEFASALQRVARAGALPPRLVRVTAPLAALLPRAIRSRAPSSRVAALALAGRLIGALHAAHLQKSDESEDRDAQGAKLLPTVHDVWASLVPRLSDAELPVALAAMHVLATIATAAGSFLRVRIGDNVVPVLQTSLLSFGAVRGVAVHAFSSQHKRTAQALECLTTVAEQCDLPPATLTAIGALAQAVERKYDWRELADVSARLTSIRQTTASALAEREAKCSR
jgi:hypothetical protein